jgi:hypothetical protein
MEGVEVRRLDKRVAVASQIAVTLVVGKDEDNIGPGCIFG